MSAASRWANIAGYEGRYSVSTNGEVFSYLTEKMLRPGRCSQGYVTVNLRKAGASKSHYVHILVARAFLENPERKLTVNHKDGKRARNILSNLEWATFSENHKHAYAVLGRSRENRARGSSNPKSRAVCGVTQDGSELRFETLHAAAKHIGVTARAIGYACARNGRAGTVQWRYCTQ